MGLRWSEGKEHVLVKKDMLHYVQDVRGSERNKTKSFI